jgi:replicative DNA helicase
MPPKSSFPEPDLADLRLPPHSIESEQSVLGGLLLDNEAWDRIVDVVSSSDFYRYDHRLIFQTIGKLITAGRPADVVTVYDLLDSEHKADEIGGLPYLNAMAQNTPSAANIRRYAEIVRERGIMRKLLATYDELAARIFKPQGSTVNQLLDEAETRILSIAEESTRISSSFLELNPLLLEVIERTDQLYSRENQGDVTGTATGFTDLDKMTSGLHPGELIIIAGRPSMGKTALAINIAEHVALQTNLPIIVFSMEMAGAQLATRLLGSVGKIDQHRLRTGQLTEEEWPRLTHGAQKLSTSRFYIDETSALTVQELRARARRLARQCGQPGLVVVDYLQLMASTTEGENRATEVSDISRNLKWLAKELNCPVVALSQLNRALEQRQNKRPIMSDLRESGAIEQDADLILFIYRDEVYNPDSQDKGTAELIIGKQRNGPIGTVRTTFSGEYTRFDNYISQRVY